jgi:hypothetical protein
MKTILTVVTMLTVAPLIAATTLVFWVPDRFGGSSLLAIPAMAFFGVISVPLWPTYIPALVVTPLVMNRVARFRAFVRLPLPVLGGLSLLVGAPAGVCVMIPVLQLSLNSPSDSGLALMWAGAGGVSGAITLTVISFIHRLAGPRAEPNAAPNDGPATPPPIPRVTEGPSSVS